MLKRIFAIFRARNLEFVRDRSSLGWNIVMPVVLVVGLSFIFGGGDRAEYTVGILQSSDVIDPTSHPYLNTRYTEFVVVTDDDIGLRKIGRHQLDLLVRLDSPPQYWVNPDSPKGYFAELTLLQSIDGAMQKGRISGEAVRYVDWVLPGILGMNMMFSCLFGVGYVIVRYRKNGFLKRLRATPLNAIEFIIAQVASRLVLIITITAFVFIGTQTLLDIRFEGSYLVLLLVALAGAVALISLGLLIAARVTSEELAGGLLNLATWPMMVLSGVWFSLEGADESVQQVATIFPLTHVLSAARAVILDGAGLVQVGPQILALVAMSVVFLTLGAALFRWHPS